MFGSIGITELIIIFVVALVVIGPKRLPDLAKTLGKTLRDFKRATSDFQDSIDLDSDVEIEETSSVKASTDNAAAEEEEPNRIDPHSPADPPDTDPTDTDKASSTEASTTDPSSSASGESTGNPPKDKA